MKSKNVLNKVVNVCGKDVGERQEQLSQVYEHCVVGWNSRGVVFFAGTDSSIAAYMQSLCAC